MLVEVHDGRVEKVQLNIFEPPRFFEALLRGRDYSEAPDITARICGICPVAYQMSACLAMEDAFGVTVPDEIRLMRRLLYCGEWIESHALHIFFLHAPDFLGFDSGIDMAREHRGVVESALRIKRAGNELMSVVGGRSVHPVNVKVGGFHRMPTVPELAAIRPDLVAARDEVLELVPLLAGFDFPDFEQPYLYVSLGADNGYPLESGALVSSEGLRAPVRDFEEHVVEEHVAHSNALHARFDGQLYVVGPLARYSLHADALSPLAAQVAHAAGLGPQCRNPFRSILVRTVELVYALDERSGSSTTGRVVSRRFPLRSGPAWVMARQRRHAVCSITDTASTSPARSLKRRSYPPHLRTSPAWRTTCGCSCRTASTCLTMC